MIIAMISIIHANQVACSAWWFFGSTWAHRWHPRQLRTRNVSGPRHSMAFICLSMIPILSQDVFTDVNLVLHPDNYIILHPNPESCRASDARPAASCATMRRSKAWEVDTGGSLGRRQLRWTCWNDDEKICVYHTYVVHYMHNSIHLISSYQFISYMTLNDIDILLTYKIL